MPVAAKFTERLKALAEKLAPDADAALVLEAVKRLDAYENFVSDLPTCAEDLGLDFDEAGE